MRTVSPLLTAITVAIASALLMAQVTVVPSRNNTSSPMLVLNGTAAAPAIAPSADPATGIFFNVGGTNRVGISGGGVAYATFTSSGLVLNTGVVYLGSQLDMTFSRVAAGQYSTPAVLFAALGTPANGTQCYCSDCTIANPCAGGGTGARAMRLNSVWVCN